MMDKVVDYVIVPLWLGVFIYAAGYWAGRWAGFW